MKHKIGELYEFVYPIHNHWTKYKYNGCICRIVRKESRVKGTYWVAFKRGNNTNYYCEIADVFLKKTKKTTIQERKLKLGKLYDKQ